MYLLDSDAARALCRYGLINELAAALGIALNRFAVLPQLKYQLKLGKPGALAVLGSQAAVALAEKLVARAVEAQIDADSANLLLLGDRPDIDAGEQILFASLAENEQDHLVTGDKRALAALALLENPELQPIWARIICLEEAIALIVAHSGVALVSRQIRAVPEANVALTLAFGKYAPHPPEEVLMGLRSYVRDVVEKTQSKYRPKNFETYGLVLG